MFHQTPSHSLTLLSCENQPAFHLSVKAQAGTAELTEASVQRYTEQMFTRPGGQGGRCVTSLSSLSTVDKVDDM